MYYYSRVGVGLIATVLTFQIYSLVDLRRSS